MRIGAVGAALKGDALGAELPASGRAIGQEPHGLGREPDSLCVLGADEHRWMVADSCVRHGTATSVFIVSGAEVVQVGAACAGRWVIWLLSRRPCDLAL